MTNERIALLVDSGTDVPNKWGDLPFVYTIPLQIIYKEHTYLDKIEISPEEVYARLTTEIPSTSLPNGQEIEKVITKIKEDGYDKIIAVTISSGLSGTFNVLRLLAEQNELEMFVLDTKSVGIGAGLQAIHGIELIQEGLSFEEIQKKLEAEKRKSSVYFTVATLEYLQKGGRIGLVSSIIGTALRLNPTISCNEDGIYYTVAKTRGRTKSLEKMISIIRKDVGTSKNFRIAVAQGDALEDGKWLLNLVKENFPEAKEVLFDTISPALVVHTGPGLIGIGIQVLD